MMKEYIKRKAKQQGISLQDIANALELKSYPSFLRTIENGDNLKAKQLRTIATMLNCTVDELLNAGDSVDDGCVTVTCDKCGNVMKFKRV